MEKLIVVHADLLLSTPQNLSSFKKVAGHIKNLLGEAQTDGKTVERIDSSNPTPRLRKEVYVIGDDVSARRALEVIQPGDRVRVAGLYRDVCVNLVGESAKRNGAHSQIIEEATIEMNPDKWI